MQSLAVLLVLTVLALLPRPVEARGDAGMYAVSGIEVDATADTAAAARDKAIAEGARKGLEQLLRGLTTPDEAKSLPQVTDKTAAPLVQDFDVESERASATRYIARLGFHFRADGVRALLESAGVRFVGSRAPLTLVVPVYRAATGDLLWQPQNVWRLAWKDAPSRAALVPVVVPDGTPEDAQAFTAGDLQDADKLSALAQRYKADSAVVVIASALSPTGAPGQGLQLTLTGGGGPDDQFRSAGAATPSEALGKGVDATLAELDRMWKQHVMQGATGAVAFRASAEAAGGGTVDQAIAPVVSGNQFAVRADFNGPGEWSALHKKLTGASGIRRIQLKALSRDQAVLILTLQGGEDQLAEALASSGLSIGPAEAVPAGSSELATMVPDSGPGAGLIYPLNATGTP